MNENLVKLRLLIKEFLEKEENKDLFFFGLIIDTNLKHEMGLCRTPNGELDPDVIREYFRDFILRNFSEKDSINGLITNSIVYGMLEGLVRLGYAEWQNISQNPFKNHPMAN